MKILKVIVDKLPEACSECTCSIIVPDDFKGAQYVCPVMPLRDGFLREVTFYFDFRPQDCPLEVESGVEE